MGFGPTEIRTANLIEKDEFYLRDFRYEFLVFFLVISKKRTSFTLEIFGSVLLTDRCKKAGRGWVGTAALVVFIRQAPMPC